MTTIISSPLNYNVDDIAFSEPQTVCIPDSDMSFKRINIQTKYKDGTLGDLVFSTSRLFSFGVSEETSRETGKVSGYKMPLCCWNIDGASKDELAFTNVLEAIAEKCKDHVLDIKDDIEKYDLQRSDLRKICSALYWKMEKGKRVEGQGPTLYGKLVHYRKDDKFGTTFFHPTSGHEINPIDLIGKRCDVRAAVKIDNIYVGRDVRVQIKILEAAVEERSVGGQRLLARPSAAKMLTVETTETTAGLMGVNENDDAGSLASSDDEEDTTTPTPPKATLSKPSTTKTKPKRKIVKRRIAKR
jgi:hypothetical protein